VLCRPSRLPLSTLFPYTTLFRSRLDGKPYHGRRSRRAAFGIIGIIRMRRATMATFWCLRAGSYANHSAGPLPKPRLISIQVSVRSEEHTSELQSRENLVCRLLLE